MLFIDELDTTRVGIIGPGRLGTSFAYKLGRDNIRVMIYYHQAEVCREINRQRLNPIHLTPDLAARIGGMDAVPRLPSKVMATNDLERVVQDNDFLVLALTMDHLTDFLYHLKPLLAKKAGKTCLISPIKGLKSDEITRILITPSQLIDNYLREIRDRYEVVCIGGPFLMWISPWVIPFV